MLLRGETTDRLTANATVLASSFPSASRLADILFFREINNAKSALVRIVMGEIDNACAKGVRNHALQ